MKIAASDDLRVSGMARVTKILSRQPYAVCEPRYLVSSSVSPEVHPNA